MTKHTFVLPWHQQQQSTWAQRICTQKSKCPTSPWRSTD